MADDRRPASRGDRPGDVPDPATRGDGPWDAPDPATHDAGSPIAQATFGPATGRVERLLDRIRTLTEAEGLDLLAANRRELIGQAGLGAALRDVVHAAHRSGRVNELERADRAARAAVAVFPGSPRAKAVGGIAARTAELLVVQDHVTRETFEFLTAPWREVVGGV